jgi:hypothetical protein
MYSAEAQKYLPHTYKARGELKSAVHIPRLTLYVFLYVWFMKEDKHKNVSAVIV